MEYLGNLFRAVLDAPARKTDHQVGEQLLRELLLIHLDQPADKLQLVVQMLLKLYALVSLFFFFLPPSRIHSLTHLCSPCQHQSLPHTLSPFLSLQIANCESLFATHSHPQPLT